MGQKCNTPILTCKNDSTTGARAHRTQWDEWAKPDSDPGPDREQRSICY